MENCVKFLNNTLNVLGYNSLKLDLSKNEENCNNLNIIYALVTQIQKDQAYKDESIERQRRLQSDCDLSNANQSKLQQKVAMLERELNSRETQFK